MRETGVDDTTRWTFTDIFYRWMWGFENVWTFRSVFSDGITEARHQRVEQAIRRAYEERFGLPKDEPPEQLNEQYAMVRNDQLEIASRMADRSVALAESATDAASLVFAHSLVDGAAFDYCSLIAMAAPDQYADAISKKKVELKDVKALAFSELYARELREYLADMQKNKSLLQTAQIMEAYCKPGREFHAMKDFKPDWDRIKRLDELRNDIVHRTGVRGRIPDLDEDLWYMYLTCTYFKELVVFRYGELIGQPALDQDRLRGLVTGTIRPGEGYTLQAS